MGPTLPVLPGTRGEAGLIDRTIRIDSPHPDPHSHFISRSFDALLTSAVALLLPSPCVSCGAPLETRSERYVCALCWQLVATIRDPRCRCGYPLGAGSTVCAQCAAHTQSDSVGRSIFLYQAPLKEIIHAFKYGGRPALARQLAARSLAFGSPSPETVLVPVPSHPRRMRERGFSPASELARWIAATSGLSVLPALRKIRKTRAQAELTARERAENLRGAFSVSPYSAASIVGGFFTIVDDVFTTGSTIRECTSVLRLAGAKRIEFFTVARTL